MEIFSKYEKKCEKDKGFAEWLRIKMNRVTNGGEKNSEINR